MTIARGQLIDVSVTRWYHCMSRCVRGALLLCEGPSDRKEWIENRIEELAQIFALGVGGFSVMDNHLHLLLRLEPEVAAGWSDDDVVRRWGRLFPQRDKKSRASTDFRGMGSRPARGRSVGGASSRAATKHQLVYEMPEGTALKASQPRGSMSRGVFSGAVQERGDSR